jgi:regulatory protein
VSNNSFTFRSDEEKARASALASLSMREHSTKELKDKLTRKGYEVESIDVVIAECLTNNYLNDQRFTEIYCRNRSSKGFGQNKILMELKMKGINSTMAQEALQQPELDFYEVIKRTYQKKFKNTGIKDFKDKAKRQNYLYHRGFDMDAIRSVIN